MKTKEKCVVAGGRKQAGLEIAALSQKLKPELDPILLEKNPVVGGRANHMHQRFLDRSRPALHHHVR